MGFAREETPRVNEQRVDSYVPLRRVFPDRARCRLAGVAAHCSLTVTDLYCSYRHSELPVHSFLLCMI